VVTGRGPEGIGLGEERIPAANMVWAAGVAAATAGRWLGIPTDRAGRAIVEPDLTAPGHPEIMVIGDTAAVAGPDGRPVPGVAAAAKQMGRHAALQIRRPLAGQRTEAFRYRDPGSLATIGRNAAVARIWRTQLSGMPAWALWAVAHIWFLAAARNRLMIVLQWGWSWASHARPVRLITGEMRQRPTAQTLSRAA
jgi:NADH dehydrogenase